MYAIVKTGGKQYKVAQGDVIEIEKLDGKVGTAVEFPALLVVDGADVTHIQHLRLAARESLKCLGVDVGGEYARARASERLGTCAADAGCRRGDHRGLARQSLRFHRLLVQFRKECVRAR